MNNSVNTGRLLILGALSFTAALAWRDAIAKIFDSLFGQRSTMISYIIYAVIITIIVIVVAKYAEVPIITDENDGIPDNELDD